MKLQSKYGFFMIGSVEKLNGHQSCPAKIGTAGNIHSSRATFLPVMVAPDASRTGWARALALLIRVYAQQRHPSLPREVVGRGAASADADSAGHSLCPRTRISRQKCVPCAPGSSRWLHLASATCAAQSCKCSTLIAISTVSRLICESCS